MSYNPHFFGPAIWKTMHVMAASATNPRKRELYILWLNSLTETLPCDKCRLHFIENLKNDPVEPYSKNNISLFYHSWKFHDTVNQQTFKAESKRLNYDEAFEMYFGKPKALADNQENHNIVEKSGVCEGDCGSDKIFIELEQKNDFNDFKRKQNKKFINKNE